MISLLILAFLTPHLFAVVGAPSPQAKNEAAKGHWSTWRGPNRDGLSAETGLLSSWQERRPKLAWKVKGLGNGLSSVAVTEGRIYTMGNQNDRLKQQRRRKNLGIRHRFRGK